ncbi:hypothetical protein [Vibrio crassostreae]|uniref:hypothetical protein n=1 Tax=Vibrio crassostreae TaxID=246167 RepID=UPI001B3183B2|nr:hypothetical protein [Vibrio crassostreae]
MENTVSNPEVEQEQATTPQQQEAPKKGTAKKSEKISGGSFRREMAPIVNDLLEDFDTAPLNINASKDLDKISYDLVIIGKALDELKKALKTEKRGKTSTPVGSKLIRHIEKAINTAIKYDAEPEDAQQVLAAIRQATTKLNGHVNSLKVAKENSEDKDRFTFS